MSSVSQSRSFRLITATVSILLIAALTAVVLLTFRTEYAAIPTATPRPSASPTSTSDEISASAMDAVSEQDPPTDLSRLDSAGFAYRPPAAFKESQTDNAVTFTGEESDVGGESGMSPIFLLSGGPRTQFVDEEYETLDDAFEHFVDFFAERDSFDVSEVESLLVDGVDARSVELISQGEEAQFAGRIVMAQPDEDRLFVMTGVAPSASWEESAAAQFANTLDSVVFFDAEPVTPLLIPTQMPTATPLPTATPTPIPLSMPLPTPNADSKPADLPALYSNANFMRELAPAGSTLWVATDGGIVAWNRRSGGQIKFTALDGLAGNHFNTVTNCPLPGLGIVFGSSQGLQVFDSRSGTWNALTSENSGMSHNDVSVVRCYPEFDFAVIGYEEHGLDIYDADTNDWQNIGRTNGLAELTVDDVAVFGDRESLWVSSGSSLTVLTDGQPTIYNERNSPLSTDQLGDLRLLDETTLWIGEPGTVHRIQDGQWLAYSADVATGRFPSGLITGIDAADDGGGQVWLATDEGEVCRFDPDTIECAEFYAGDRTMPSPPYTDLARFSDGTLAISTDGHGLGLFDGETWRTRTSDGEFLAGNTAWDMVQTRDGFLWIAGNSGLQQIDPNEPAIQRLYTFDDESLPISNVRVLNTDGGGLWLGGVGAAHEVGGEWQVFTPEEGLAGSTVQAIAVDGQLRTWLGTESGLSIWNGDIFFNLTEANGLPSDDITALLADGNAMWIGSNGGGLYRFTSNQLRLFDQTSAGLPSNVITSLALSDDGTLWVGTDEGLARFANDEATPIEEMPPVPITDLEVVTEDEPFLLVATDGAGAYRFDGETWQGLAENNPKPSSRIESILVDENGTVWLGGRSGGLVRFENGF